MEATKKYKSNNFTLIEMIIAIALVAIGVTAVMSLFPIAMHASKSAIGHNYSAMAAENIFSYITNEADKNWNDTITSFPKKNDTIESFSDASQFIKNHDGTDDNPGYIWDNEDDDTDGIFGLKVQTNGTRTTDGTIDMLGEIHIWKEKFQPPGFSNNESAAKIYMEISWPLQKEMKNRNKNYYYLELTDY